MASAPPSIKEQAQSSSLKSFKAALVFNAAVFAVELGVFTLLRPYFKAIYEPRTYAPSPSKRAKPLSRNLFLWPLAVWRADYRAIKHANGMDAYFFVRFLRMMVKVFLPIWLVSWAVLFPVTAVNTSVPDKDDLDKLTFGNVEKDKSTRYAAHLILTWFFTFWIFYNIKNEMRHFITTRQQHLIEPNHAKSLQANTILVTGIPARYLNQRSLLKIFEDLPGGVRRIWINRNLKELPDIYERRLTAGNKLESAETALLRTAAKLRLKKKDTKDKGASNSSPATAESVEVKDRADTDPESGNIETASSIVPRDQRPTHRLGFLGLFGKKVDSIGWAREEIRVCDKLLEEGRSTIREEDEAVTAEEEAHAPENATASDAGHGRRFAPVAVVKETTGALKETTTAIKGKVTARLSGYGDMKYPPLNSAFVTFNKQIAAHLAVQVLAHHDPYRMTGKYNEVSPQDVIWANLNLNPYEQKLRMAASYAATAGLIILWSFPVAFVGAISNVPSLCTRFTWLAWICGLPPAVVGIISGILPPVLLAILMALLPIVLRLLARFEGIPKYTGLELSLMTRFFLFQVIHSFLIVTLSSGIIASLEKIAQSPTTVPSILASQLPMASTFFLTYIILQGLSGTAGGFLQIVRLIIYYVKLIILGSTPRSVYNIKYVLGTVAWGTLFPAITLLAVISLAYSTISPLINGLACATFFLFYQLYKYLFLWVYELKPASDTGGLFFPKAIQHIFVGLYIEQICLCALFFLARDSQDHASAVAEGALMIVLIVITAGFHSIINNSYGPLRYALPLSLKDKTYTPVDGVSTHQHSVQDDSVKAGGSSSDEHIIKKDRDEEADPDADYKDLSHPSTALKAKATDDQQEGAQNAAARQKFEEEEFGFAHPAISRPQRPVWIPQDALGLVETEIRGCENMGVVVTTQGAFMNEKGKVDVPSADDVLEEAVVI